METHLPSHRLLHPLPVASVLVTQLLCGSVVALLVWLVAGVTAGFSAAIGVLIAWLPNLYFAYRVFRFSGARAARAIVRSFYAGEAGKLVLTALLFGVAFALVRPLQPLALFGGFFLAQCAGWLAPLFVRTEPVITDISRS